MTARNSTSLVVFKHPFKLPGMDTPHPPGTFELQV